MVVHGVCSAFHTTLHVASGIHKSPLLDNDSMNSVPTHLPPWRQSLRNSRPMIVLDLALVAVVFAGVHYHWGFIVFSRTPYLLALAWISMRLRGISWRDLGLRFDLGWQRLIMVGIAAGFTMEALELFVTQPYLVKLTGHSRTWPISRN
jgi:hypothetical protein